MLFLEAAVNGYHGNFDDVCRAALYRGIDGVAFGITAHHCVVAVDVAQIAFTMVNGFGISLSRAVSMLFCMYSFTLGYVVK